MGLLLQLLVLCSCKFVHAGGGSLSHPMQYRRSKTPVFLLHIQPSGEGHGHEGRARQAQGACAAVSALLCLHPALPLRAMHATCTCAGRHVERLGGDCVRAKVWRGCCSPTRLATSPLWGFPVRHTPCATHRAPRTARHAPRPPQVQAHVQLSSTVLTLALASLPFGRPRFW